jgi:hypothetical protein
MDHLSTTHAVIGISTTNGYDLTTESAINKMLKITNDADYFLNIANISTQPDLLYKVYKSWNDTSNHGKIISFGTLATSVPFKLLEHIPVDMQMIANKLSLEKMHTELSLNQPFGKQPHSVLLRFANYGQKQGKRDNEPFTTASQMIEIVDFILETNTYISTLDFREI